MGDKCDGEFKPIIINVFVTISISLAFSSSSSARYSADSVWYAAVIDEVVESSEGKHKYVVTYTLFGNSEELAYEDLRAPSVGSEPPPSRLLQPETPSHTFHQPQQQQQQQQVIHSAVSTPSKTLDTFLVGDICEGHFTEDDTWYMCEIQEVLDNGARFKVIYTDYGNSEIIPASRVRAPGFRFCLVPCSFFPVSCLTLLPHISQWGF